MVRRTNNGHRPEVVAITGASAGVGRATAIAFGHKGARVGLIARGRAGLEGARDEVIAAGGEAICIETDVADAGQVESAAAQIEAAFGPIDIWINDAMVSVFAPVQQTEPDEYRRVTEVNYLGYVFGTQAALRRMVPRNRGTIVQVASALSYRGIPLQSAYSASKHAVQGFNDSLRAELLHERTKVKVVSVDLPALNTPQFEWSKSRMPRMPQPVPPIFSAEVAADAIYWAAHHNRRELGVGWPTILTKFGNFIAPGLADRYLAHTGYDSQMTDEPDPGQRPHNLWHPLEKDMGVSGPFEDREHEVSTGLWVNMHRGIIGASMLAIVGITAIAAFAIRRRQDVET